MRKAIIVTGLSFGDEAKGSVVDYLTRQYKAHTVIRHNGGSQAAHHVVTPDGVTHCFSQFGAGTFAGAKTFLSKYMIVDPIALVNEANHLIELGWHPWDYIKIDQECKIITPYHKFTNRHLENQRGIKRHGSCGVGVGQVMDDYVNYDRWLTFSDILEGDLVNRLADFKILHNKKCGENLIDSVRLDDFFDAVQFLIDKNVIGTNNDLEAILKKDGTIICEGAQGVLLDEWQGFHPHTTWSTCTAENAFNLLLENDFIGSVSKLGLIRAFMTRHGPGPFPTYDVNLHFEEKHNAFGEYQREFRFGYLDLALIKYAIKANKGVLGLALSHLDQIQDETKVCIGYENFGGNLVVDFERDESKLTRQNYLGQHLDVARPILVTVKKENLVSFIEDKLKTKIYLISSGPTFLDKVLTKDVFET